MNVNDYLGKQYPSPPCWFLVSDVYTNEFSQPVDSFQTVNSSIRSIASAFRLAIYKNPNGFRQITAPVEGCIVLLGKTEKLGLHHCGVFTQGKILHMLDSGGYFEELSVISDQYALIEYWGKA